jgi:UTP--glucose-1-phosphate uridylyltransferase
MPKELLPIIDKPIIQFAVEEAIEAGCTDLIFVTGRTKRAIEDHFDSNPELNAHLRRQGKADLAEDVQSIIPERVNVIYTRQREPLGLGHAIHCAAPIVGDKSALVLLADDYILPNKGSLSPSRQLCEGFSESGKSQVSVMEVPTDHLPRYGVINPDRDGRTVNQIIEKPKLSEAPSNLAAMGRYLITPDVMGRLAKTKPGVGGEIQFTDALDATARVGGLEFCKLEGIRYDCGDKLGYLEAIVHSALSNAKFGPDFEAFLRTTLQQHGVVAE